MKKFLFATMLGLYFTSCTGGVQETTVTEESTDTLTVETVEVVDTLAVDSIL